MRNPLLIAATLSLAACSGGVGGEMANDSEPDNGMVEHIAVAADWPDSLKPFGDGYPKAGDPCRRVGESDATRNYLDDSADLVGCPTAAAAQALGGKTVATIDGITLVSVSSSNANPGMAAATGGDFIRKKGGLEDKCKARVAKETGNTVTGTNRIEQSEAAIDIFVNVKDATAPWRCRGYKDGTIGDLEFIGSEGDL